MKRVIPVEKNLRLSRPGRGKSGGRLQIMVGLKYRGYSVSQHLRKKFAMKIPGLNKLETGERLSIISSKTKKDL